MAIQESAAKARLSEAVEARRGTILDLSHRIHATPEPAFEERFAAQLVAETMRAAGFEVEHPAGRLETAVLARLAGGHGADGPRVAVLAEYDALPGLGHACGHNSIAASAVGAALALAEVRDDLAGEVLLFGTPAEERGSGKQVMLEDGLFEGVDAVLEYHPSDTDGTAIALLACEDVDVVYRGLEAHAATDPWLGRNALDALVLLFSSIGLWRQQLKPQARVHGVILEGGTAANIIPSRAVGQFMLRAADYGYYQELRARFSELVAAAAQATGCAHELEFSGLSLPMRDNPPLRRAFAANMRSHGREDGPETFELSGSSDIGNVSQVCPTIHPHLAFCDPGTPAHTDAFRAAAVSARGDETTLLAATLLAETAFDVLTDPALVEAAWAEHRAQDP